MKDGLTLLGAAIDACAGTKGSADTPEFLVPLLKPLGLTFADILRYDGARNDIPHLQQYFTSLAKLTKSAVDNKSLPLIIGGDHSCAIGSWSGVAAALSDREETLGLIWIDAHMDSHTPETSPSGNIHGMPVATLMGYGYSELISILTTNAKIQPQNISLIGIRSYEEGEAKLLAELGVQIYYSHDVESLGFAEVFHASWQRLAIQVDKIGLSIDLDGFDPKFAPGVGTPEPDGVNFRHFMAELEQLDLTKLVGVEISEGNHHFDPSGQTMQRIIEIIHRIKCLAAIKQ